MSRTIASKVHALAAVLAVVAAVLVGPWAGPASAAGGDVGFRDFSYTGASAPSVDKPESKLWFAQGSWWGVLFNSGSASFDVYRLDRAAESWVDTGVVVDRRANSQADVLWDGSHLLIASHVVAADSSVAAAGHPAYLTRLSPAGSGWSVDAGFPVVISDYSCESLTIDEDSAGLVWATWTQAKQVEVAVSAGPVGGAGVAFGAPFAVPVAGASGLTADDISALVATGNHKIVVVWSNQAVGAVYYAVHNDGQDPSVWHGGAAVSGPHIADDHLNLKSLQSDAAGRVYAAVKTSLNDPSNANPNDPLINLMVYTPSLANWRSYPFSTVADSQTRPILLLDDEHQVVHMFATGPSSAGTVAYQGTIYEKTTAMGAPSFPPGEGTPVIRDGASAAMNNATSTKQPVNSSTGLVVLASNDATRYYWHADESLGGASPPPAAPVAGFTASPASGAAPLAVSFTDTSTGAPTTWAWDFGDGGTSTAQNPSHTFAAGSYTVTLTASNAGGQSTAKQTITASAPTSSPQVLFRVNAGGPAVSGTPAWGADTSGSPSPYLTTAANTGVESSSHSIDLSDASVPAGTPMSVFQTGRYDPVGKTDMTWSFPVSPGQYTVKLFFAETYFTSAGSRVFNVAINNQTVLSNFDVYAAVGANKGLVKSFSVNATGNAVQILFTHVVQNPDVRAVEIDSA